MEENVLMAVIAAAKSIISPELLWMNLQSLEYFHDIGCNQFGLALAATHFNREKRIRIPNYFETWVQKYEEYDFFTHFRMVKGTYHFLVSRIRYINGISNSATHYGGPEPVALEKAVLVLLWYLAKGDTYISIADRFNIGVSTAHGVVAKYLLDVVALRHRYIKWPSKNEADKIAHDFEQSSGYPGVIGAIDGTHFPCVVPKDQHDSYQNRKLLHSIIMQAVSDCNKLIIDIFVGYPGSCNDGRVLHDSPLYRVVDSKGPQSLFYQNYHLVGDKAYVCYEWLMTPYRDTGRLTRAQKKHNYILSKARVLVEHVFGLLKGRWRILKFVNVYEVNKVINIIVACCVLHNICLIHNDTIDLNDNEDEEQDSTVECLMRDNVRGTEKRDQIMNYLN